MSRSYRKIAKITGGPKSSKRRASKAVRRYQIDLEDGKSYKKVFPTYDIRDYKPECFDKFSIWFTLLKRK